MKIIYNVYQNNRDKNEFSNDKFLNNNNFIKLFFFNLRDLKNLIIFFNHLERVLKMYKKKLRKYIKRFKKCKILFRIKIKKIFKKKKNLKKLLLRKMKKKKK